MQVSCIIPWSVDGVTNTERDFPILISWFPGHLTVQSCFTKCVEKRNQTQFCQTKPNCTQPQGGAVWVFWPSDSSMLLQFPRLLLGTSLRSSQVSLMIIRYCLNLNFILRQCCLQWFMKYNFNSLFALSPYLADLRIGASSLVNILLYLLLLPFVWYILSSI